MVFHGQYALHRVSPVQGKLSRLNAVFDLPHQPELEGRAALQRAVVRSSCAGETTALRVTAGCAGLRHSDCGLNRPDDAFHVAVILLEVKLTGSGVENQV